MNESIEGRGMGEEGEIYSGGKSLSDTWRAFWPQKRFDDTEVIFYVK